MGRQSPATTPTPTTTKVGKKKSKKRICKHFASGHCKFGEKCKNIHEGGNTKDEVVEPPSATNSQGGQVSTPPQPPSSTPNTNINTCLKSDLKELKDQALVTQKHLSEMNLMMAKLQMSFALANSSLEGMQSKISDMENRIEDETPNEGRDVEEETHRVQQQAVSVRDNNEIPPAVTPTSITSTKKSSKIVPSPPTKPQSTNSTNKAKATPSPQQPTKFNPLKSSDDKPGNKEEMKLGMEEDIKASATITNTSNKKTPTPPHSIKSTTTVISKPDKPQEKVTKSREHQQVDTSAAHTMHLQPKGWPALGDIDSKVEDEKKSTAPTTREVPSPPPRDDNTRSMLDDIIINASGPYIGSPDKYISNLRKELDFSTAEEFVEIINECLDVLALMKSGNTSKEDLQFLHTLLGGVEKGKEDEFCRALLSAVSIITGVEATTPPIVEAPIVETPRVVVDEMEPVKVAAISTPPVVPSRPVKRSVIVELGGGARVKSTKEKKAHVPSQEQATKKVAVDKKVARPDRATRKEAKKKEQQTKRSEALKKKKEVSNTITLEQTALEVVRKDKRKSQYTAVTGGNVSPPPTGQEAPRGLVSPRHSTATSTRLRPAQASTPIVKPENFSLYIKRNGTAKENQGISPIFNLLQSKTTRDEGRQLMQLEGHTKTCKQAIAELYKRKVALAKSIDIEHANIAKWKREMEKIQVEMKVKWSLDNLLTMSAVQLNRILRQM